MEVTTMKNQRKLSKIFLITAVIVLSAFCLLGCGGGGNEEENALEDMALLDIIDKIYEITPVDLSVYSDNIDITDPDTMSAYTGLTNLDHVKEAAISEAMISSQAYSMVLVRADDDSAAANIANEMKSGINPSKWVCVTADDLQVVSYRDVILLFMVSSDLSETITSQQIVDAFRQVCGGDDLVSY